VTIFLINPVPSPKTCSWCFLDHGYRDTCSVHEEEVTDANHQNLWTVPEQPHIPGPRNLQVHFAVCSSWTLFL
jgi:hypothetical protein